MKKQVEFHSKAQQRPILVREVGEQGLARANICYILHTEDIDVLCVYLHRLLFHLCFSAFGLRFGGSFFLCLLLLGKECLLLGWIFPFSLLLFPIRQSLGPSTPLSLEPVSRLQVVDSLCHFSVAYPRSQDVGALLLLLPDVSYLVEAFGCTWQSETSVTTVEHRLAKVFYSLLAMPCFLFFLGELHWRFWLFHLLILLFLLHLFFSLCLFCILCFRFFSFLRLFGLPLFLKLCLLSLFRFFLFLLQCPCALFFLRLFFSHFFSLSFLVC
mmetsp:Transcript_39937/g.63424  ORF Transcript_39937/g.63424 Transcript_39937/m.63424 type:complete len:270 (+) Transcript_39937:691-1500(+)